MQYYQWLWSDRKHNIYLLPLDFREGFVQDLNPHWHANFRNSSIHFRFILATGRNWSGRRVIHRWRWIGAWVPESPGVDGRGFCTQPFQRSTWRSTLSEW